MLCFFSSVIAVSQMLFEAHKIEISLNQLRVLLPSVVHQTTEKPRLFYDAESTEILDETLFRAFPLFP